MRRESLDGGNEDNGKATSPQRKVFCDKRHQIIQLSYSPPLQKEYWMCLTPHLHPNILCQQGHPLQSAKKLCPLVGFSYAVTGLAYVSSSESLNKD